MRRAAASGILAIALAGPALARDPLLRPPIDCDLPGTCFIQQYADTDPGPGAADFTCGPLSYDGHKGTDFALPSLRMLEDGVDVRAAAPGRVVAIRDGMADIPTGTPDAPELQGRDCGNGVLLSHGDGWETQYCHLKKGTIAVRKGQRVDTTTVLGEVGLSGDTSFPHVHLSVRHAGDVVDPFNPDGRIACGRPPARTLWVTPVEYAAGGLIAAGFHPGIPEYDAVKAGNAGRSLIETDAPALVIWGYAFGGQEGDVMELTITGPEGEVIAETVTLDKTQAQLFRAAGRRTPGGGWPAGTYDGTVSLSRGGKTIDTQAAQVELAP